jgi:hypothetical protein
MTKDYRLVNNLTDKRMRLVPNQEILVETIDWLTAALQMLRSKDLCFLVPLPQKLNLYTAITCIFWF